MSCPCNLKNVLLLALFSSACARPALRPIIDRTPAVDTQELATRFGYPKCTVSVSLSDEESAKSAEFSGTPHIDEQKDWLELTDMMMPGEELRHVLCNPHRGPGCVNFLGVFRDEHLIAELHTVIVD